VTLATATLIEKRTLSFLPRKKSETHLVVIKQLLFAHVGLPNLFTFYWLSGGEAWHSAVQASDLYYEKEGMEAAMYKVSNTVRSTYNQDGAIVLNVRQGQMFNVNFVGSRILELLKNGSPESAIVDEISREFDISRDLAENDVREFLQALKKCHLVEEHEPSAAV
jgi:hypothetical protein